jgi:hypothetical protein
MNHHYDERAAEYHVLANRLREGGHQQSAEFYEDVARRCDEAAEKETEETRQ